MPSFWDRHLWNSHVGTNIDMIIIASIGQWIIRTQFNIDHKTNLWSYQRMLLQPSIMEVIIWAMRMRLRVSRRLCGQILPWWNECSQHIRAICTRINGSCFERFICNKMHDITFARIFSRSNVTSHTWFSIHRFIEQTDERMESIDQARNKNKSKKNRGSLVNTVHKNIKSNVEKGEKIIRKINQVKIDMKHRMQNVLKIENADGTAVTYEKLIRSGFLGTKTITAVKDAKLYDYYKQELKRLNKIKEKQSRFIASCKSHPMWNETVRRSNAKLVYNESKRIKQNKRYESKKKKEDETKRNQKKRKMSETDEMHVVWGVPQGICNGEPPPKKRKKNDKMEEDANVDDELYQ
eukprot:545169_1